jgi:hypothetical protein
MSYASRMLDSFPGTIAVDTTLLAATTDALTDCAQACSADVSDDLAEPNLADMVRCIRLCMDCADICTAATGVMSRQAGYNADVAALLLQACAAACRSCGDECERHAQMHLHCRVCAEACRRCERACRDLLDVLGQEPGSAAPPMSR